MSVVTANIRKVSVPSNQGSTLFGKLNSEWHKRSLQFFMIIVLAHWAEHLTQAVQIYLLGWPRPVAGGALGFWFPWLVSSEVLHYGYAVFMLAGLWMLRSGFTGTSRRWWMISLGIQVWHHFEHLLLQAQAIAGYNLIGSPVPVSVLQMIFPKSRVEIHLFYNAIVFIPMIVGMYYHMFPPAEENTATCTCALHRQPLQQSIAA